LSFCYSDFLTIFRDLNRRGTPRTAFEFARLLFSLDPHTDPLGALLHLDFLAIKAKQADWLLGMWNAYSKMGLGKGGETQFDVTMLPGWCWSRALALFEKEGEADDV
jgi:transcription factor 25